MTVFWVHKDMSNYYREGIDKRLKSMAQPYKTKVLKKCEMTVFGVHEDASCSYRDGIDKKMKSMAQPYKMKVFEKSYRISC